MDTLIVPPEWPGSAKSYAQHAPYFNELPAAERERMRLQRAAMLLYASILMQRIAAFT